MGDFSTEHFFVLAAQACEDMPLSESAQVVNERKGFTRTARKIARRLESLGQRPFQSDRARYFVRLDDSSGEIVELGRPLRGSRIFKKSALARDIETVRNIEAFAASCKGEEWLYWNIRLPKKKAAVGSLVEANVEFNRLINIHFSELRRNNGFELILLVIHPRFDLVSGCFDLHAHIICRIPREHREAARRRLLTAFSEPHVPDDPVRNVAGCATYMIWGICPMDQTLKLPDAALSDLFRLCQSKARLVRKGSRFGKWTRENAGTIDEVERERRKKIRKNRAETTLHRPQPECGDRLLAKAKVTLNGEKVFGLIFERSGPSSANDAFGALSTPVDSSSSTIVTTQDSANDIVFESTEVIGTPETDAPAKAPDRAKDGGRWDGAKKLIRAATAVVARALRVSTAMLGEFARRLSRWCRGSP